MKILINHYVIYDLEDNYIMEGTCDQICKRLGIVKSTITKAVKNEHVVRRKYRIYKEGKYEK